jgi:tetratricopeptide (TPR) repeat protein
MIEQLSRVLSRALMMKDAKEYIEAVTEVKKAGKLFLGLNPDAMDKLSDKDLLRLWRVGNDLDAEKCALAAQLFKVEGQILEEKGDEDGAVTSYLKSLSLLAATVNFLREKIPHELVESVDFLDEKFDFATLPVNLREEIFATYSTIGRFAKAEDLLFEIVDEDPSFAEQGKLFYEQLLKRTDKELEQGNLPRAEVLEGLAQLNKTAASK